MRKCIVCGEETARPFASAFSHFYLHVPGQWKHLGPNIKAFGWWSGITSTLALVCPAYNTLRNWRYRKDRLVLRGKNL
jgi:hypothetical protein